MDAKVGAIRDWLLPLLREVRPAVASPAGAARPPFVLGLSGVQGSGKSTIVSRVQSLLQENGYRTAQFSLDDLYLTHADQVSLARTHPTNQLLQSRGQFGTHDTHLANTIFSTLRRNAPGVLKLPVYDKGRFKGQGDRAPESDWPSVHLPLDCLIFEGWCVGFQPLPESTLRDIYAKHSSSISSDSLCPSQLSRHAITDVVALNDALREYTSHFMGPHHFDALICLAAQKPDFVYTWREQQEQALRSASSRHANEEDTGSSTGAMSPVQVREFVDRYYPSYELYLATTLAGIFHRPDDDDADHHHEDDERDGGKAQACDSYDRQLNLTLDVHRRLIAQERPHSTASRKHDTTRYSTPNLDSYM